MKRILFVAMGLLAISSCVKEKLTVYDAQNIGSGQTVTAIKGEGVRISIREGDTVKINLSDSEIYQSIREDKSFINKLDTSSCYVVQRIYKIDKE